MTLGLVGGDDGEVEIVDVKADDPPLDADLLKEEKGRTVQECLLGLDEDDRAIVVLREIEEKSYGEIGSVLGLAEGTVKSRLFRARAKLKGLLEQSGKQP